MSDEDKFMQVRSMRDQISSGPLENVQISRDKEVGFCFGNIEPSCGTQVPTRHKNKPGDLGDWREITRQEERAN